jgi:DNA-binding NarL/FixJ family response regulator
MSEPRPEAQLNLYSLPQPTVVLVDDHTTVREALAQLLEENGFTVLAHVGGRAEALSVPAKPDLMLVDLSLGDEDGLELVADMQRSDVPVVVCSTHEEPEYVRRALNAGARAYVAKRDAGHWLARTMWDVLDGWVMVSPRAAEDLSDDM